MKKLFLLVVILSSVVVLKAQDTATINHALKLLSEKCGVSLKTVGNDASRWTENNANWSMVDPWGYVDHTDESPYSNYYKPLSRNDSAEKMICEESRKTLLFILLMKTEEFK